MNLTVELGQSSEVESLPSLHMAWKGRREGGEMTVTKRQVKNTRSQSFLAVTDSLGNFADLNILSSTPLDLEWGPHWPNRKRTATCIFQTRKLRQVELSLSYQAGFAVRTPHLHTKPPCNGFCKQCQNPGSLMCRV